MYVKNGSEVGNCYGHVDPAWLPLPASDGSVDSGLVQWPCENDADCSLNGECVAVAKGVEDGAKQGPPACRCSTGWHGDRCELLKLAPVDRNVLGFNPHDALNGGNMYGTFRLNFHRFDRFELDLRVHTQPYYRALPCPVCA